MNTTILLILVLLMVCSPGFSQKRVGASDSSDEKAKQVAADGNGFAVDLYARLAATSKGNLFFSPSSIHTALAMTYVGARGRTAGQMARTLHNSLEPKDLTPAFQVLLEVLNSPQLTYEKKPAYQLSIANALWAAKGYPFDPEYLNPVKAGFGAMLAEVDFSKQEAARKRINDWVSGKTGGKIKDLLPPGFIQEATRLVLTNAIYFKSDWANRFNEESTREKPFTLPGGEKTTVPMMYQEDRFGYLETGDCQGLELEYWYHCLSMFILLPRKADGLAALEKTLTAGTLSTLLAGIRTHKVKVTMPRFTFSSRFSLGDTLQAMGMKDAFDPARANFKGMSTAEKLSISAVIHEAFIAVDENGTEAAAASAVGMLGVAMPPPEKPKIFTADHPFLFLIRHRQTGAILFMGRVVNPGE